MIEPRTFDPIWEEKYQGGHQQKYPWDMVVSFVYRYAPKNSKPSKIKILEVGCGTGSNLWFAAREGFRVAGIDASQSAIEHVKDRFDREDLDGDLRVGDFTQLPFNSNNYDLVIDRSAIVCCGFKAAKRVVGEVHRVLKRNGKFLFNPYSKKHSSALSGENGPDGLVYNISSGTLVDCGQICFYDRKNIDRLFQNGWKILNKRHLEIVEAIENRQQIHAEWRVVAEKVGN
jgi:ubiquinone/menaquinone biosynthesis C-methylase UbiE